MPPHRMSADEWEGRSASTSEWMVRWGIRLRPANVWGWEGSVEPATTPPHANDPYCVPQNRRRL
jgi:hypothetical protein